MGFKTPHRVGSFSTYLDHQRHSQDPWMGNADVNMTFTTGVDGDYSYPRFYYSGISRRDLFVRHGKWNKIFYDTSSGTDQVPFARTVFNEDVVIQIDPKLDTYDIVFDGISVGMDCITEMQTDGKECNSDGIWPYEFYTRVGNCISAGTFLQCKIHFLLTRGWTPSRGGGKPYNSRMDYNVTILYTILGGNSSSFMMQGRSSPVSVFSTTKNDVTTGSDSFSLNKPTNFRKITMGIQGFGFTLLETKGFQKRGRYLELLNFAVSNPKIRRPNIIEYSYSVGVRGTRLVSYSDSVLYIEPIAILTDDNGQVYHSANNTGAICVDGDAFSCVKKEIEESATTTFQINIDPHKKRK